MNVDTPAPVIVIPAAPRVVIPAKAGIQGFQEGRARVARASQALGSRLRGNDGTISTHREA